VRLRDDLERDLELLVASMEAKGEQIARLRRHQEKVRNFTFTDNVIGKIHSLNQARFDFDHQQWVRY